MIEGGWPRAGSKAPSRCRWNSGTNARRRNSLPAWKASGREIENRVTGNDSSRLKDQGVKEETTSAADYGSAEHHEKFAESLAKTGANETQVRGRLTTARREGTRPSTAVTMSKGAAKARKSRTRAAAGSEGQERPHSLGWGPNSNGLRTGLSGRWEDGIIIYWVEGGSAPWGAHTVLVDGAYSDFMSSAVKPR